jgi:hypothetical protein
MKILTIAAFVSSALISTVQADAKTCRSAQGALHQMPRGARAAYQRTQDQPCEGNSVQGQTRSFREVPLSKFIAPDCTCSPGRYPAQSG